MYYMSTRDHTLRFTSAQAILQGLAPDGGLLVPDHIPALPEGTLERMGEMTYPQRAAFVMGLYLEDFTPEELERYAENAYGGGKFDCPEIAPLRKAASGTWVLELWHGPTCAFKDMALQMLPRLLTASMEKLGEERNVCILTATSGDTGKAAMEGFRDVPRTKIMVFYPRDGVSDMQRAQMLHQEGENVQVCAVSGNFDDAQTGVKRLFSDGQLRGTANGRGYFFSSANSINWGRILPQMAYYISSYADLVHRGVLRMGEEINICVPTGNFGNILAAWYAREMGLPVHRLICASNSNCVLTQFLTEGTYDRNRPFYTTISPSMDILISSNLERLLFSLSGKDDALVRRLMTQLSDTGRYEVGEELMGRIRQVFFAGCTDEEETYKTIGSMWREHRYLVDPHTAVALHVLEQYRKDTGEATPTVVASTASPFKFGKAVLQAIGASPDPGSGSQDVEAALSGQTGLPVPRPLDRSRWHTLRQELLAEPAEMDRAVLGFLN